MIIIQVIDGVKCCVDVSPKGSIECMGCLDPPEFVIVSDRSIDGGSIQGLCQKCFRQYAPQKYYSVPFEAVNSRIEMAAIFLEKAKET